MPKLFLSHPGTGKRFQVISVSADRSSIRLKGDLAEFDEPFDRDAFKKLGYEMVKGDDDA